MILQQTTDQHLTAGPLRRLSSIGRVVLAALVFAGVCLVWLALVLVFVPFILIASIVQLLTPGVANSGNGPIDNDIAPDERSDASKSTLPRIFDRRRDVSKLYGCNTRNVRYRWGLFRDRIDLLKSEFTFPRALDFGSGSLRDSYELAKLGFEVISFDLDESILRSYYDSYDWTTVGVKPSLMTGTIETLKTCSQAGPIQLVIAFDVIEHLEDPGSYVKQFHRLLCERGFLFTIVPNKRSLFERYFKRSLMKQRKRGVKLDPGVPHIQFKTPAEWDEFFKANGFRLVERDMAIGHFVNDWWNGLLAVPLRSYVYPVLEVAAFYCNWEIDPSRIERTLCFPWLMERVNLLDKLLKGLLGPRFGWNLIVAQKES